MADARTRAGRSMPPGLVIFIGLALILTSLALVKARPFGHHGADLSGYPTGVSEAAVQRAGALTANSNVPAAIMASIPQAYGTDPMQPARAYSDDEKAAAARNNTPIGPYQLVYNNVFAFAKAYRILPLSFNEMADPQRSGNWLVGATAAVIHARGYPASAVDFTAGTIDQPYLDPSTDRVQQRTPVGGSEGTSARTTARNSWITVLSALPIASIPTRAAGIYDSAYHWTLSGSLAQSCGGIPITYANTDVVPVPGNWANPVASSRLLTTFGGTAHDGVDLAAPAGAPVYAATNGVIKLVGADDAVAATGGKNALVVYAGNSVTFAYQDLGSLEVVDGQQVRVGQRLGTVASSPTDHPSSGPHLHFGVNTVHAYASNGATWVDPVSFMRARAVTLGSTAGTAPLHLFRDATTSVRTTQGAATTAGLMDQWQGYQLSVATTIIVAGQKMHVPAWGIQIALMTAMRGSRLGNEPPPSSGSPRGILALPNSWGTLASRNDITTAAQMFYTRLMKVPDWQTIRPWDAAAKTGAYAAVSVENYRAMWSGAGIIMNVLGTPGTTSTYGTDDTVGGGCTPATTSGPTVNLSAGFTVASFNVLGCTWNYAPYASCQARFPAQWSYINQHGFSIVGLQEVQKDQFAMLAGKADAEGSNWDMYPTSSTFPGQEAIVVMWRSDQWKMVSGLTYRTARWSYNDKTCTNYGTIDEPAVLLQNAAGQQLWALAVHNIHPGDPGYSICQKRDLDTEAQMFAQRYAMGIPVVLVGDFNDDSFRTACSIKAKTSSAHSNWDPMPSGFCAKPLPVKCANTADNPCQPYDKIIGSGGITFTSNTIDWSTQKQGGPTVNGQPTGITDHGVPATVAKLP